MRGWLLIVDNLGDDDMIERFKSEVLKVGMEGSLLVTSRNAALETCWTAVDVGELTLEEGRALSELRANRSRVC